MSEKKSYKVQKKRSGRHAVIARSGKYVNGEEKVKILATEGLVKAVEPKKEEAAAESAE